MNVALCKCGVDMSEHVGVDPYDIDDDPIPEGGHAFDAAGTKYRCEEFVVVNWEKHIYLCPRPAYHLQEGVKCGPLTGEKLL